MAYTFDKIVRKIYSNSRMELEFFMFLPSIVAPTQGVTTANVSYNPILNLRYKQNKNLTEEFDYSKATFKITPKNFYMVIKFFNNIMKWFYDDQYESLFLLDSENNLIFNADYNKLHESTPKGDFDTCMMQAIPSIVKYGDRTFEGIHLYINTSTYCIPLTYQEVSSIFGILKDFSFQSEINATLIAFEIAMKAGRFEATQYGKGKKVIF